MWGHLEDGGKRAVKGASGGAVVRGKGGGDTGSLLLMGKTERFSKTPQDEGCMSQVCVRGAPSLLRRGRESGKVYFWCPGLLEDIAGPLEGILRRERGKGEQCSLK